MSIVGNIFFGISLLGLFFLVVLSFIKNKNYIRSVVYIFILVLCGILYFTYFQSESDLSARGSESSELSFIIILYFFMILGIFCHYLYNLFTIPKEKRPKFDIGQFIGPLFASPIIFIPIIGAFQNSEIDLSSLTLPKFMIFLVAFENGFFWKEFFGNRKKELSNG